MYPEYTISNVSLVNVSHPKYTTRCNDVLMYQLHYTWSNIVLMSQVHGHVRPVAPENAQNRRGWACAALHRALHAGCFGSWQKCFFSLTIFTFISVKKLLTIFSIRCCGCLKQRWATRSMLKLVRKKSDLQNSWSKKSEIVIKNVLW